MLSSCRQGRMQLPCFCGFCDLNVACLLALSGNPSLLALECASQTNSSDSMSSDLRFSECEYLLFVDPAPALPPSYSLLPPGGCPRFPVIDLPFCDDLPSYSAAAYKIGLVARKVEWLSPYEPSHNRLWKSVIIELNSTQLNFYEIPSSLLAVFTNYHPARDSPDMVFDCNLEHRFNSGITTDLDCKFHKLVEGVSSVGKEKRLIRLYLLQHARIGLAVDYLKKPNALRLRLENEQMLVHFASCRELIEWHLGLCVGKDVSLDISERLLPRYRTVPRRRVNSLPALLVFALVVARRKLSTSLEETVKSKFSRLKTKLTRTHRAYTTGDLVCASSVPCDFAQVQRAQHFVFSYEDEDAGHEPSAYDEEGFDLDVFDNQNRPAYHFDDYKWNPVPKNETHKKFLRNCIKCIKPLLFNDPWVDKLLVKALTVLPLSLLYLKNVYESVDVQAGSLDPRKKIGDMFLPDFPLARLPSHFLKEYIVASHTLIPREIA